MGALSNEETKGPYFGRLYRQNVLTDSRNAAPIGWHSPTYSELATLVTNTGGAAVSGGNLKDTSSTFLNPPNTGANNSYGFNLRGIGECRPTFQGFKSSAKMWSVTPFAFGTFYELQFSTSNSIADLSATLGTYGQSFRCIKDDSTLPASMVGNDGTVYPVVKIGSQVWQALPSIESKYRNGDLITLISDSTTWGSTTYPARRYPQDNAAIAFQASPNVLKYYMNRNGEYLGGCGHGGFGGCGRLAV